LAPRHRPGDLIGHVPVAVQAADVVHEALQYLLALRVCATSGWNRSPAESELAAAMKYEMATTGKLIREIGIRA